MIRSSAMQVSISLYPCTAGLKSLVSRDINLAVFIWSDFSILDLPLNSRYEPFRRDYKLKLVSGNLH